MLSERALALDREEKSCREGGRRQLRLVSLEPSEDSLSLAALLRNLSQGSACFACGSPLVSAGADDGEGRLLCLECGAGVERVKLAESAA